MIKKYLNPQNDVAFKRIFGQPQNQDILLALLNTTLKVQLNKPLQEVQLLPRDQDPEIATQKTSVVDVICRDEDDCVYIVEMQVADSDGFKERAQYYAAKAYISQANRASKYSNLQKVIFLAFTNYPIFPDKKVHKSDHQMLDIVSHEQDLDKLVFTFVDLATFSKQNKKPVSAMGLEEKFYYFLAHAQDITPADFEAMVKDAPVIDKAFKTLDRFYWTKEELQLYEDQEKRDWDYRSSLYKKGMNDGEARGIEKGRVVIHALLRKGIITEEEAAEALKGL